MGNTIVVQVTTSISRSHLDTQRLIEPQHPDWSRSGLRHPSAINGSNIYTIEQADVARTIGSLSEATMQQVNRCLMTALGLANV
jgi:mRNA-degrading endonuclease toxin of MazEF toxin-antitoxin module